MIQDIKNASILFNKISKMQADSIPRFAYVALENVESVEVEYDLDHSLAISAPSAHAGFFVKYYIKTKSRKGIGNRKRTAKQRMKDIETWVKGITYNDVIVKFFVNGKEMSL